MRGRTAAAVTAMLVLAGCGRGEGGNEAAGNTSFTGAFEEGFRTKYREKFVASCTAGAQQAAARQGGAAAAALDFPAICGCAADKLLATKSVGELVRGPSEADQAAVTQQCMREHPPRR